MRRVTVSLSDNVYALLVWHSHRVLATRSELLRDMAESWTEGFTADELCTAVRYVALLSSKAKL